MKKLYFIVQFQLDDVDGFKESNGWKTITVYSIADNVPVHEFEVEIACSENSIEAIQGYLDDNGMGDDTYQFTEL